MNICIKCNENEQRPQNSYCRSCHNEYQKAYYKKNPRSINESSRRRKKAIRDLIIESKNIPCTDCNIKYPYYVMDFDHLRDKKFNLSVAASKYRSMESVSKEIIKCEVVCANCHRARTFSRN
jgi:hypothetical protein